MIPENISRGSRKTILSTILKIENRFVHDDTILKVLVSTESIVVLDSDFDGDDASQSEEVCVAEEAVKAFWSVQVGQVVEGEFHRALVAVK